MRKIIAIGMMLCILTVLVGSASAAFGTNSWNRNGALGTDTGTGTYSEASNYAGVNFGPGTFGGFAGATSTSEGYAKSNVVAWSGSGSSAYADDS